MAGEHILTVDDDAGLRQLIGDFLREHGYRVTEAVDAPGMRAALAEQTPDLIVLDLMMPGEDGLAALRALPPVERPAVLMLSALGGDVDRIIGLETGADDYLAKPCNPRELLARIRAVLRRAEPRPQSNQDVIRFGDWTLDPGRHELTAPDDRQVSLTATEFRMLVMLAEAGGRVLSREYIVRHLSGEEYGPYDRAVDIAISRLRRKLAEHDKATIIRTVRGEGYACALPVRRS